jgi:hypothetical protein
MAILLTHATDTITPSIGTLTVAGTLAGSTINAGAATFTTITASSMVSGAGFVSLLAPYAPLAAPALTGIPTAPTATAGTNTMQLATTAFVASATGASYNPGSVAITGGAINGTTIGLTTAAAGAFSTLLATGYLNFGYNTAGVIPPAGSGTLSWNYNTGLGEIDFWNTYAAATISFAFFQRTSTPTAVALFTISPVGNIRAYGGMDYTAIGANSASTGAFTTLSATSTVSGAGFNTFALLASPALTGIPTAPTATAGTNTTQLATTAFVATATGAAYNPGAVAITGGTINGTTIGATLPSSAAFTTLTTSGTLTLNGSIRAGQGIPNSSDFSTNGYAFGADADTGLFSPITGGGASNGVVSLFGNSVEILRGLAAGVTVYGTLAVNGAATFTGGITATTTGINFGSVTGASVTDVSKHINMYGGTFGLNITGSTQNYIVPTGSIHSFIVGGTQVGYFSSTGLNACAIGATTASAATFTTAIANSYFSSAILYAGNGMANFMSLTGGSTGNPAAIGMSGTDTNVGLTITAKGTGVVSIPGSGGLTVSGPTTLNGALSIASTIVVGATLSMHVTALTYASTITPNCALGNYFSVTLTGNSTLANPTNITAGTQYQFTITQDATGSRTLAYGSVFKFANRAAPTLTTTASAVDVLTCFSPDGINLYSVLSTNFG